MVRRLAQRRAGAPGRDFSWREGLLPGDFVSTVEKDGLRLGIMGLNSAFLQRTGDNYRGHLDLSVRQVHHRCDGNLPGWVERHHLTLLLTHHPISWLHTNIAPQGYFYVHLFGHMHEAALRTLGEGGRPAQVQSQGASLFGQETYGESEPRIHGYSAARLTLTGSAARLRLWPRVATRTQGGYIMGPDLSFAGLDRRSYSATASLRSHVPLVRAGCGVRSRRAGCRCRRAGPTTRPGTSTGSRSGRR